VKQCGVGRIFLEAVFAFGPQVHKKIVAHVPHDSLGSIRKKDRHRRHALKRQHTTSKFHALRALHKEKLRLVPRSERFNRRTQLKQCYHQNENQLVHWTSSLIIKIPKSTFPKYISGSLSLDADFRLSTLRCAFRLPISTVKACSGGSDVGAMRPFRHLLGHAELFWAHLSSLIRWIARRLKVISAPEMVAGGVWRRGCGGTGRC
jgi:hypothetical protein